MFLEGLVSEGLFEIVCLINLYMKSKKKRAGATRAVKNKTLNLNKYSLGKFTQIINLLNFLNGIIHLQFWNCPLSFLGISR